MVATLSGGNQQKVVVGKFLLSRIVLFLLDEPTRGIDVGAKAEIYQLVGELAQEGTSFLLVSSEMPELLAVCDRIYVLCDGRLTGEFERAAFDQEAIMEAATRFADDDASSAGEPVAGEVGPMTSGVARRDLAGHAAGTSRVSLVDVLRIVAAAVLLVGFVLLPWFIAEGASVTGLGALISGTAGLPPEADAALASVSWALLLIPLGHRARRSRAGPRGRAARAHPAGRLARAARRPGRAGLLRPLPGQRPPDRRHAHAVHRGRVLGSLLRLRASCSSSTSPCGSPPARRRRRLRVAS